MTVALNVAEKLTLIVANWRKEKVIERLEMERQWAPVSFPACMGRMIQSSLSTPSCIYLYNHALWAFPSHLLRCCVWELEEAANKTSKAGNKNVTVHTFPAVMHIRAA